MLAKEIWEVMAEDKAEENFVLYWSWILHNFIHTLNTTRVPELKCVVTSRGKKLPAVRYSLFRSKWFDDTIYCVTSSKRYRSLSEFCKERPLLTFSMTSNGLTEVPYEDVANRFGIHGTGYVPCDRWFITATTPLCQVRKFAVVCSDPPGISRVCVSFIPGLNRLPTTVESFDSEAFDAYLAGEPCDMKRIDMLPVNSVYFRKDPKKLDIPLITSPFQTKPVEYIDDDVSCVLEIT